MGEFATTTYYLDPFCQVSVVARCRFAVFVDRNVAATVDTAGMSGRGLSMMVVGVVVAAAVSGCAATSGSSYTDTESPPVTASTGAPDGMTTSDRASPGTWTSPSEWRALAPCRYAGNGQPDHGCTPGATNPAVTQATITTTICRPGYTKTVRPPWSVTAPQKRAAMTAYGVGSDPSSDYEFDHLIPLEVGGSPDSPHNLFPQQLNGANGAHIKDKLENKVHQLVCNGTISLRDGQAAFTGDWLAAWDRYQGM